MENSHFWLIFIYHNDIQLSEARTKRNKNLREGILSRFVSPRQRISINFVSHSNKVYFHLRDVGCPRVEESEKRGDKKSATKPVVG